MSGRKACKEQQLGSRNPECDSPVRLSYTAICGVLGCLQRLRHTESRRKAAPPQIQSCGPSVRYVIILQVRTPDRNPEGWRYRLGTQKQGHDYFLSQTAEGSPAST